MEVAASADGNRESWPLLECSASNDGNGESLLLIGTAMPAGVAFGGEEDG